MNINVLIMINNENTFPEYCGMCKHTDKINNCPQSILVNSRIYQQPEKVD